MSSEQLFTSSECQVPQTEFMGRERDLDILNQTWTKYRVFGIFGIRSVGKSQLVQVFLHARSAKVLHLDLRTINDMNTLYTRISAALRVPPENMSRSEHWILQTIELLQILCAESNDEPVAIFFDNAEDTVEGPLRDNFLSLCFHIVCKCPRVKVFLTSTMQIGFAQLHKVFFSYELLPLESTDSLKLLKAIASTVDLDVYADKIVALSEGLPLLILMIGSQLELRKDIITPEVMVELLVSCRLQTLSNESYPPEDRVAVVYKAFVERLIDAYRDHLTDLNYIPGTFNEIEAGQLVDATQYDTSATSKSMLLLPLRRRHVLNYDPTSGRFDIQGILREILKTFNTIKDLPGIRERYCRIFSAVMKRIAEEMGTERYTKALSEFTQEQPNLQKLLNDVTYTKQNTYYFFIEMATSCTQLIEVFFTGESEKFYQGCLKAADMYGSELDKSAVFVAVGSLYSTTKGDYKNGAEYLKSALQHLDMNRKTITLATLYQKLGWNYHKQGNNPEAICWFQKAVDLSSTAGEKFREIEIQALSDIGVSQVILGNFDEAEKFHFTSLKRREAFQGAYHPLVGSTLNNIGLLYEQKGNMTEAFNYYKRGLEIKWKYKAAAVTTVASLSNVANSLKELGEFQEAHKKLDDAEELIKLQKIPMQDATSLIYNTRGKVLKKEGRYQEAKEVFDKCIQIREINIPKSYMFMKTLENQCEVLYFLKNYKESIRMAKRALHLSEEAIKMLPHNFIITECLKCMANVYIATNDWKQYRETLYKIEEESLRLERVCMDQFNKLKLDQICDTVADIRGKLLRLDYLNNTANPINTHDYEFQIS